MWTSPDGISSAPTGIAVVLPFDDRLVAIGDDRVVRTSDDGANWAELPNPCEGVEPPTAFARDANYLTSDELREVLAFVEEKAPEWYPAVILDAFTGLRWGSLGGRARPSRPAAR